MPGVRERLIRKDTLGEFFGSSLWEFLNLCPFRLFPPARQMCSKNANQASKGDLVRIRHVTSPEANRNDLGLPAFPAPPLVSRGCTSPGEATCLGCYFTDTFSGKPS